MTVEKLITDHIDIWSSALQTRSTAGRGSNGKIDLYGIKKLRELILSWRCAANWCRRTRMMNRRLSY